MTNEQIDVYTIRRGGCGKALSVRRIIMNKRQKKKRLERKKKEMLKGVDFVEKSLKIAAEMMRKEFYKMPDSIEKFGHHFFIAGIEYTVKMLDEAKNQIRSIE